MPGAFLWRWTARIGRTSYLDVTNGNLKHAAATPEPGTVAPALLSLGFGGFYADRQAA